MTPRSIVAGTLLSLVLLAACDDDDTATADTNVAGTYTLQTVNGQAPPATTVEDPGVSRLEVTGGTFVLRADRTYTETLNTRTILTNGSSTTGTQTEVGTYATNGNTVLFTIPASGSTIAFSDSSQGWIVRCSPGGRPRFARAAAWLSVDRRQRKRPDASTTSHADIRGLNRRPGQSRMTVIRREGPLSRSTGSGGRTSVPHSAVARPPDRAGLHPFAPIMAISLDQLRVAVAAGCRVAQM
jgi:hypothetical protein